MIFLRNVLQSDSDILFKWINDPMVVKFNARFQRVLRTNHDDWFSDIIVNPKVLFRMIQEPETLQTVGSCQLLLGIDAINTAELRIRIGEKDYWGKGIGSEAVKELIDLGFSSGFCESIRLWVRSDNIRAIKSYQKNGFEIIGLVDDVEFDDVKSVSMITMQINRDGTLSTQ
jgi:RimJ/RimL family protein N-acetyltransferase